MKRAVICFTRVPRPGQVKTRLLSLLGGENCAKLQWAFLRDISRVYANVNADLFVAFTPDPHWETLKEIFPYAAAFFPQDGADLGARMDHAFRSVFALGYDACVLTGSDLPLLTEAHLNSAFEALEQADVAIGPTPDGGYYLAGMKQPCPAMFANQTYGNSSVYENTVAAVTAAGYTLRPAAPCADVDTPADLREFWAAVRGADTHAARFLRELTEAGVQL